MGNKEKSYWGEEQSSQATAIIDPMSGKLITSKQKIKEVSLQYCKDTLTNYEPLSEYKEIIRKKKEEMKNILQEGTGSFFLQRETFKDVLLKFKRSKKRNYDFWSGQKVDSKQQCSILARLCVRRKNFLKTLKTLHSI